MKSSDPVISYIDKMVNVSLKNIKDYLDYEKDINNRWDNAILNELDSVINQRKNRTKHIKKEKLKCKKC